MLQLMNACVVAMWQRLKAIIAWTLGCRPDNVDISPPNPVTLLYLLSPYFPFFTITQHTHTHTIFTIVSITRVTHITQDPSNKPTSPSIPMTSQLPIKYPTVH